MRALDAGADDYITKPFHISELIARLRAACGGHVYLAIILPGGISIGEIELDSARRSVRKAGRLIHLTPKEFDLLHYLMAHAGLPITHQRLLQGVWGRNMETNWNTCARSSVNFVSNWKMIPLSPSYILTEAYIGYRFRGLKRVLRLARALPRLPQSCRTTMAISSIGRVHTTVAFTDSKYQ